MIVDVDQLTPDVLEQVLDGECIKLMQHMVSSGKDDALKSEVMRFMMKVLRAKNTANLVESAEQAKLDTKAGAPAPVQKLIDQLMFICAMYLGYKLAQTQMEREVERTH